MSEHVQSSPKRPIPLRVHLFLSFLPIVLLPVLLMGVSTQWRYQVDTQTVAGEIREELEVVGNTRLKLITGLLANAQEVAETIATWWPDLRTRANPNAELLALAYRSQIFAHFWVADAAGRVRYSTDPAALGQSLASEAYWQAYRRQQALTFSGLERDEQGRTLIRILVPLDTGETLVAAYTTDQLQYAFRNLHAAQMQRYTFLTDAEGNLIAHSSERALLTHPNLKTYPPVAEALQGYEGTMEYKDPINDLERVAAYLPVTLTGWALVTTQPSATAILMPATASNRITLMMLAFSLGLTLMAVAVLSRQLATPIERACEQLRRLSQMPVKTANFSRTILPMPISEFESVQRSVQRLYESLARSYHDLEAKNRELIFTNQQLAASVENFKRLDKLRADFINILSHDLRIPLTAIIGYAELLQDDPALPTHAKPFVEQILQGCERMRAQLDELLDYARMEVGRFKLRTEPVDLNTAIPETLAFFQPIAEREGLKLVLELPEHLPTLHVDPDRLRQILNNLVSNAIKYTPAGGTVTVRAYPRDHALTLEVQDTGIGLSDEDRAHLFEKFFRSSRPEVQKQAGSGIGLALVKGVVEALGGRIEAEGSPGKGATFRVTLPLDPPQGGTP